MHNPINISALVGPGISAKVSDVGYLAKYTATKLVKIEAHVGRNRGIIPMPDKQLGIKVDKLGEKGKGFYSQHMEAGRLSLIPKEDEARLGTLEARLRNAIHKVELCDGLVPIAAYASLKTKFQEIRKDYFDAQDDICARWDTLVDEFKAGATEMLNGIRMQKRLREQLLKTIFASIPSENDYRNSFYMELDIMAFPAQSAPEGLSASIAADINKSWGNTVVATAIKSIEKTIGKGFSMLGQAAKTYTKKGMISGKTLEALEDFSSDMGLKNVFGNPMLDALSNKLQALPKTDGSDEKEVIIEEALLDIWAYAKEQNLSMDVSCTPFSADTLDSMLKVRQAAAAQQTAIPGFVS